MTQRNISFDIMKGIGMLAVIIGHINDIPYMPWRHLCFSFHMPLFFLLGGYFYKINPDIKSDISKSFKRLIIPYLAAASIMVVYSIFISISKCDLWEVPKEIAAAAFGSGGYHHSFLLAKVRPIGAIWFLLALFWCRTFFNIINVRHNHPFLTAGIVAIIATLIDYYIINLPFAILPGLSAMMFYALGYYFKIKETPIWIKFALIISYPFSFFFCKIYMVQCAYQLYPLAIAGACGGTLLVYLLSDLIRKKTLYISKSLSWIGRLSLVILCWHMLETLCHVYIHVGLPKNLWLQIPIRILFPIILTYYSTKFEVTRKIFQIK